MLPALVTIVAVYCSIRLWSSAASLWKTDKIIAAVFIAAAMVGTLVIGSEWWSVQRAGQQQAEQTSALQERMQALMPVQ